MSMLQKLYIPGTGKSLSEALIFALTNPQYDNRLFIELQVQYMKIPNSNLGRTSCVQKLFLTLRTIFYTTCSPQVELGIFMYWTFNSVNNLLSYCGLVDAKIRASDKDLPVTGLSPIGSAMKFLCFIDVIMFHISATRTIPILPICWLSWKVEMKKK